MRDKAEIVIVNMDGNKVRAKTCNACSILKPLSDYYASKRGVGGKESKCKRCFIEAKNQKRVRSYALVWFYENRDRLRIRHRETHRFYMAKRRALKSELDAEFTLERVEKMLSDFNGNCALSGASEKMELDHFIPLSWGIVGTVEENMIPLCKSLNISKSNRNPITWASEMIAAGVFSEERWDYVISYLSKKNNMPSEEYIEYIHACYKTHLDKKVTSFVQIA